MLSLSKVGALACAAALLYASCTSLGSSRDTLSPLQGMVYDADNRPVSEASVLVNGRPRARTDVNGRFAIPELSFGDYALVLRKDRFEDVTLKLEYNSLTQVVYVKMISAAQLLGEAEEAFSQRRWAESERKLSRCLALDGAYAPALFLKASLAFRRDKPEEARDILLGLLQAGVDDPFIHLFLADLYQYRFSDPVRAAEQLRAFLDRRYDPEIAKRLEMLQVS